MYLNSKCNETEMNFNMGTCLLCFNQVDLNFENSKDRQKVYEACSKYLHSAITKNVTLGNLDFDILSICKRCLESASQLVDLTEKLEVFQRNVSEYILMFSLEIFQRRANPYKNAENSINTNELVLCNFSGLQDGKSPETVTSFQSPLISMDNEHSLEQTDRDPLLSGELINDNFLNSVTFEKIIKTENFENEVSVEDRDGNHEFNEMGVKILDNNISGEGNIPKVQSSHSKPCSSSKKLVTFAKPNRNVNPFVKLEQLINPGLQNIPAGRGNNNALNTNTFNVGCELRGLSTINNAVAIQSDKSSLVVNKSGLIVRGRYLQKNNTDRDPDFKINKTCHKSALKKRRNYPTYCQVQQGDKTLFKCLVCQKEYRNKQNLVSHFGVHTGEKPFSCSLCNKTFRHRSSLYVHRRCGCGAGDPRLYKRSAFPVDTGMFESMIDTDITDEAKSMFGCSVCKKIFNRKGNLRRHFRVHTGEKPYKCTSCNRKFRFTCGFNVHVCKPERDEG